MDMDFVYTFQLEYGRMVDFSRIIMYIWLHILYGYCLRNYNLPVYLLALRMLQSNFMLQMFEFCYFQITMNLEAVTALGPGTIQQNMKAYVCAISRLVTYPSKNEPGKTNAVFKVALIDDSSHFPGMVYNRNLYDIF